MLSLGVDAIENFYLYSTAEQLCAYLFTNLADYKITPRVSVIKKIISSGDFLKINLILSYFGEVSMLDIEFAVKQKINKHIKGIGKSIFSDRHGYCNKNTCMDKGDLINWYELVFESKFHTE